MERIPGVRYPPLLVVAALALIVALAGSALGGTDASSAISSKTVKKIAAQQVAKLAPGLSVANATKAGTADNAANAANAANAGNAAKVAGADVCSGTVTIQNNGSQTLCSAGSLSVTAVCSSSGGGTQARIDPVVTGDAWAFGERIDPPATESPIAEVFLSNGFTIAEGLDSNASSLAADGSGVWISIGAPNGSSISGNFGVRANFTGSSQGTCLYSMGAIAR